MDDPGTAGHMHPVPPVPGDPPPRILVLNPGSTSTRVALYRGTDTRAETTVACPAEALAGFARVVEQIPLRTAQVMALLETAGLAPGELSAIAARGGPLRAVPGGVYRINASMLEDAGGPDFPEHVSRIACLIAAALSRTGGGVPAFVVDPVSTDEYAALSRISGLRDLPRRSMTHALNLKRVARAHAREAGREYRALNLITAHLGGGISMAVHTDGRMVDSVDANGEGPFSPERAGGLRSDDLARLASGADGSALRARLVRMGGLMSHLGTSDLRQVEKRIDHGDETAAEVFEAMAYAVSKHICALAAAVCGRVDAILLTGGMAHSERLVGRIAARVSFLAPVRCYPGEMEMQALRDGVLRVLSGAARVRTYPTGEYE